MMNKALDSWYDEVETNITAGGESSYSPLQILKEGYNIQPENHFVVSWHARMPVQAFS